MAILKTLVEALFRLLFTYECEGAERIPGSGGAVVAANHPSYLDPILLSLESPRLIRFMAWDALFRVPLLGPLMHAFGAFPVDIRRGKGREAYARAKALIQAGEVVGVFPEGKRSRAGWMEPALREGAARLSRETGAPLVPATITGAFRAWPHFRALPRPASIKVRFHDPIDPIPFSNLPEEEALPAMLAELRQRVERSLLPGVKADLRINVVYRLPSEWPRIHESLPPLLLASLVFWKTRSLMAVAPAYGYIGYLLLDHFLVPQSRFVKRLRNVSPVLFLLGYAPVVLGSLGLPEPPAGAALVAIVLGALFPYLYERGRTALDFIRGLVVAGLFELAALLVAPLALGPHVALPLYAAAYAWTRRTVFSSYAAPVLAAYALGVGFYLGDGPFLVPHAAAGLAAWLVTALWPYRLRAPRRDEPPEEPGLGLRLS